jgi:hypothetical protein
MADRYRAQIEIGGAIRESLVPALVAALQADQPDGCDEAIGDYGAHLMLATAAGLPARFADGEATGGRFEAVEEFCQSHRIAFRRQSAAYAPFDAEVVVFRPDKGMAEPQAYCANDAGDILVPLRELKGISTVDQLAKIIAGYEVGELMIPPLVIE